MDEAGPGGKDRWEREVCWPEDDEWGAWDVAEPDRRRPEVGAPVGRTPADPAGAGAPAEQRWERQDDAFRRRGWAAEPAEAEGEDGFVWERDGFIWSVRVGGTEGVEPVDRGPAPGGRAWPVWAARGWEWRRVGTRRIYGRDERAAQEQLGEPMESIPGPGECFECRRVIPPRLIDPGRDDSAFFHPRCRRALERRWAVDSIRWAPGRARQAAWSFRADLGDITSGCIEAVTQAVVGSWRDTAASVGRGWAHVRRYGRLTAGRW
jgi:hypothetical protein